MRLSGTVCGAQERARPVPVLQREHCSHPLTRPDIDVRAGKPTRDGYLKER